MNMSSLDFLNDVISAWSMYKSVLLLFKIPAEE